MPILKKPHELEIMAEAGKRLARVLVALKNEVKIGVATKELEEKSRKLIRESGSKPAFLGYRPAGSAKAYPYCLCVSINDVVVHGQPSEYVIREGDIVKLDLGLKHKGFYVDSAITIGIGKIDKVAEKLIQITREALSEGIKSAEIGKTTGDIGRAIERYAKKNGFSVVQSLTGHGIGKNLHEDPVIFNFGKSGEGIILEPGMVIAIEPMISTGSGKIRQCEDDSFATQDGSLSAHFEHTVAITISGPRILTTA